MCVCACVRACAHGYLTHPYFACRTSRLLLKVLEMCQTHAVCMLVSRVPVQTSLKGLLVIGDLGLGTANPPASVQDWRAPALGYSDLAQYLAAYQTLHRDTSQNKSSSRR